MTDEYYEYPVLARYTDVADCLSIMAKKTEQVVQHRLPISNDTRLSLYVSDVICMRV